MSINDVFPILLKPTTAMIRTMIDRLSGGDKKQLLETFVESITGSASHTRQVRLS
jgi:hypothetical protein